MRYDKSWLDARTAEIKSLTGRALVAKPQDARIGGYMIVENSAGGGYNRLTGGSLREMLAYLDGIIEGISIFKRTPDQLAKQQIIDRLKTTLVGISAFEFVDPAEEDLTPDDMKDVPTGMLLEDGKFSEFYLISLDAETGCLVPKTQLNDMDAEIARPIEELPVETLIQASYQILTQQHG